ncbi:cell division protein FtsK [Micromonospora mirobrigensis]|uniref:DNA segregation ATPase FtsK/SpoIIIE, S-DNA-T family n=1 Tax=Micromonospora mirobrigensis TaxID=262898 RepID=A0A1C4ZM51_9ACTN|nr:cell division protein FtsK [Micromonospora mirobrigensis]SCF33969.1 DNA segregation ATPase FtsK/SpoIIIE, S-DNA-T family [Micromonospora mirobrigensis]
MANPHPHDDDRFDWQAAENDLTGPDAEVVDLDAARSRRDGTDPGDDLDDDNPTGGPVLVDSIDAQRRPRFTLAGFRDAQRRPILPGWLRSRSEFTGNLTWATGLAGHGVLYHGLRVPKYAGKLAWRAPAGLGRVVGGYGRWLFDLEAEPVRQAVVRAAVTRPEEAKTYETLARRRDRRVRWRGLTAVALALVLLAGVGVLLAAPPGVQIAALAVALLVFGVLGAPADRPLLDTAVVRAPVTPLTSDEVVRALAALNIPGINQALRRGDTGKRWFPAPITRENGTGWRADVELPRGVTASAVVEKREELAAALTRPLGCVWPEANAEIHPGRLVLFVADKDMSRSKQNPWPLLKSGAVDLFKPFPFGTDPRGRAVTLTLMFASMIVGSIPRMGKTFSLRLAMLGATLDPRAWVLAFDLKGTGDLSPLEPVCHRYRAGDEDEDIAYGLAAMREIRTELRRRTKVIRELPRDLCPENKVTPDLASTKRLGLQPIVIGVDECQVWFEHPKYGDEFEEICTDLIKRGPAAGITLILATQRPDAKSLPTGISANAVLRFCLKVMGHTENDMVLGTSMHKSGIKATMFSRRDRGIGYLAGEGDDPTITRTFYIDGPTAEQVVRRARALREKAGTLTGHAAGQVVDTTAVRRDTLLDDIAAVMSDTEAKLWSEVVCDRLAGLRPEIYAGLTREQLTAALKPYGVTTGQVWGTDPDTGKGANRRGIDRAHILTAITKRDRDHGGRAAG